MQRESITTLAMATTRRGMARSFGAALVAAAMTTSVGAQAAPAKQIMADSWRISAAAGAYVPRSAVIVGADGRNTRLGAGPSVSLELQYLANRYFALYGGGFAGFSTLATGTAIQPTAVGPSNQVTVLGGTGGLLISGALGSRFQPTLRIGGGLKGYSFDLKGATNQWRPAGDFGVGFRGAGSGPIDISAELRVLPNSFDQGKLPIRGIVPQAQSQMDMMLTIGVSIRP